MAYPLKIIIVEAAYLVQSGFRELIRELPGMTVVEIYEGNEKRLADKILSKKPDVVIINPGALKDNLISLVNRLKDDNVLPVGLVHENARPKCKSPFRYCLNPGEGKYELLEVLKRINKTAGNKNIEHENTELTHREKTILKLVVKGHTTQEIAGLLFLSTHTVNTHRKNISNKLGIKTLSGLTVYALMNKIVRMGEIE